MLTDLFVKMGLEELHFLIVFLNDLVVVLSLTTIIICNHGRIHISEKLEGKTQANTSGMYLPYNQFFVLLYYISVSFDGEERTEADSLVS